MEDFQQVFEGYLSLREKWYWPEANDYEDDTESSAEVKSELVIISHPIPYVSENTDAIDLQGFLERYLGQKVRITVELVDE